MNTTKITNERKWDVETDDFYNDDKFKVQKLSQGGFIDNVDGKIFTISTFTIRLSPKALNEYFDSEVLNSRSCYENYEDYEKYVDEKAVLKEEWKAKVCDMMGISVEHTTIKQVVSEIFGVCHFEK